MIASSRLQQTAQTSPGATPVPSLAPRVWAAVSRRRLSVISIAIMVIGWQLISLLAGRNGNGQHTVPDLIDLATAFKQLAYYWKGGLGVKATDAGGHLTWAGAVLSLVYNSATTGIRLVLGLSIGLSLGIGLAVLTSWSLALRSAVALTAHLARMLPLLAMVPLFSLWFGDAEIGAVAFIGFTTFALIFVVAVNAIGNVPGYYAQYALALGASRFSVYRRVILPAALPQLRTGILLCASFGWSSAIAAEFLGQQSGLGEIAHLAEYFSRTNTLALLAAITVCYSALTLQAASWIMDRAVRWAE